MVLLLIGYGWHVKLTHPPRGILEERVKGTRGVVQSVGETLP